VSQIRLFSTASGGRWRGRLRLSALVTLATLIGGCVGWPLSPNPAPAATTGLEPVSDTGWEALAPGLERRVYRPGAPNVLTSFVALRIDPALYSLRAHYQPGQPLTASGWQEALPGAAAFVNANFFDPQGNILGLLVADGTAYGSSFIGFGGMAQVQNGAPRVRSLIAEPYAGEPLEQAVQAFPMLLLNGQPTFERTGGDRPSRRTIIGQDSAGRIVLMTTNSLVGMRLAELGTYLASTDLGLVHALNLDGGGSTLMVINAGAPLLVPSFDPVPAVLAVYPK
jgi:uncharacterized protein YigE (DUF2233 family)